MVLHMSEQAVQLVNYHACGNTCHNNRSQFETDHVRVNNQLTKLKSDTHKGSNY